jgi:hypothetical protein
MRTARFLLVAVAATLLAAACGSDEPTTSHHGDRSGDGGASSGGDGGNSDGAGRYTQGVYACCAKGEGRSCCPPDSLPDPETGRSATCFAYGGVSGDCTAEGASLEAKDICSLCCGALVRVDSSAPASDGSCEPTNPPSVKVCAACGDGACGSGENRCNCPEDCP